MHRAAQQRAQVVIASVVLALVLLHLGWEMVHGGVVSHHLLARSDMPSISNWWGIVLVPALAWFVAGRVLGRPMSSEPCDRSIHENVRRATPAFCGALAYGGLLAASFAFGFGLEQYLFLGLFVIGLVLPIYRGEYILGFVLGMMFTFGGILPMIVAAVVASISWAAHVLVRAVTRLVRRT